MVVFYLFRYESDIIVLFFIFMVEWAVYLVASGSKKQNAEY